MRCKQEGRTWRWTAALAVFAIASACASSAARREEASSASSQDESRAQTVDHLLPARDSIGSAPTRFSWTAIDGADSYAIGVWSEVDVLIWRQNNIPATSVTRPDDVRFEPGTYFWSVSALREGRQIGESGLAAFVVRE